MATALVNMVDRSVEELTSAHLYIGDLILGSESTSCVCV